MNRHLIAAVLLASATLSGCQPVIRTVDINDPKVQEILTRPGLDEAEIRAEFEKLFKLSEGAILEVRQLADKVEVVQKSDEEQAAEVAGRTFTDRVTEDGPLVAAILALLAGGGYLAKRKFGSQKPQTS